MCKVTAVRIGEKNIKFNLIKNYNNFEVKS